MKPEITVKVNYGIMGLVLGAVVAIMIGLKGGFLVPKDAAEKMVNAAVLAIRADICIAQFRKDPHYQERLKELKALNFVARDGFIEKGGWDKMPGDEKASIAVNRACGDKLAVLMEK